MRRKFCADGIMHIYQRTRNGFNIFYSLEDFLVFFTIVSVQVRKFGINMLGLCLMIDHIHILASAENLSQISQFISAYTSIFVKEFNEVTGRKGPLFEAKYGSALKLELKRIRSAIAYLLNNPVEKKLCTKAQDYKWNFLKYLDPNKKRQIGSKRNLSRPLQRALTIVDDTYKKNKYLRYQLLTNLLKQLNPTEKELLSDYIITIYLPIDKKIAQKFFKSYDDMVLAVNSNTGTEYEITEAHFSKSDIQYREILQYLKTLNITDAKSLISATDERKVKLASQLKRFTSATTIQIKKFLHIV